MRVWRCGDFELALDRPLVMGVVNATPDSFYDGGRYETPSDAVAHALRLYEAGADIIDIGGESTRPGAEPVSVAEEITRVRPVVSRLASERTFPVSVDTRRAEVAKACVEAGASIINDVSGFCVPAMRAVAAGSNVGVVVMHMPGEPATMQDDPRYGDVVAEIRGFLLARADDLTLAGVGADRICIDPGIGFGKTLEHNLELLRRVSDLVAAGYPVLLGVSRKRFIATLGGAEAEDPGKRLGGSIAAAVWAIAQGVSIVRVHDVAETVQALQVWRAITKGR